MPSQCHDEQFSVLYCLALRLFHSTTVYFISQVRIFLGCGLPMQRCELTDLFYRLSLGRAGKPTTPDNTAS